MHMKGSILIPHECHARIHINSTKIQMCLMTTQIKRMPKLLFLDTSLACKHMHTTQSIVIIVVMPKKYM